jgi:uncharacterized protein (TIGR03083 family)
MLDVRDVLAPERAELVALLRGLAPEQWARTTECPAYTVQGVATHVLGDDLSLLSRQRDGAPSGLLEVAAELPGVDFRTVLDTFNDRWVSAARFFSTTVLVELLELAGAWTAEFYRCVDLEAPCEPVFFFGSTGEPSPYWQAIAREYVERWVHHSQIRRALGLGSLVGESFIATGIAVAAAVARVEASNTEGSWSLGPIVLGDDQQTADILTKAHSGEEIRALVTGPTDFVDLFAALAGR